MSAHPDPYNAGASTLTLSDSIQQAASFGVWSFNRQTFELRLSPTAAELLAVEPGDYREVAPCLGNVVAEDRETVLDTLRDHVLDHGDSGCSFRVSSRRNGLRWLRLSALPGPGLGPGHACGFIADITPVKQAEIRERFILRFTQLLIGTHTIDEAIARILSMVCVNLGWEWGAYWTPDAKRDSVLVCRQAWHDARPELAGFSRISRSTRIPVGAGLVGRVWSSAQPTWIEDMQKDPTFLRQSGAQESGLQSGYAFPVVHVGADGSQQRFGVLEFFSVLPRQPSAQLPLVAAAVGALIAQTVQRLEQEAAIRLMAQSDEMTGLVNRSHFHELVEQACAGGQGEEGRFGLLYIDLDRFKPINDAFGHDAGNAVLKEFARRLRKLLPAGAVAARLGGDEFAVLLRADDFIAAATTVGDAILRAARTPVRYNNWPLMVSGSIGVSVYPHNGAAAAELLRHADAAMYRSKHGGRNCISFSDGLPMQTGAASRSSLMRRMTIAAELQQALLSDQLFLEYQPIAEAGSGRPVAFEALIRWRRPDGEVMYPGQFIPVAEECGIIADIDNWVVERACHDLAAMQRAGAPDLIVSVNMVAPDFARTALPADLLELTRRVGIAPSQLCLELTERMMLDQHDKVVSVMKELRQHGFRISLDDFGTEHSSLSRLRNLPITSLKIDRSFIQGLPDQLHDRAIVRAMLELAREMQLVAVVEGIEHPRQLEALRELGKPLVQGYLIGRPASLSEAMELLADTSTVCPAAAAMTGR